MTVSWEQIEPLLMRVDKPARYVGGEFNQVVKPSARVRGCLAFPDTYEIGMSYHGYRLLYERINEMPQWAAERAYCPWPDMEALMREQGIPLWSMETHRALADFDWVGFTMQHEVNFTNMLTMLDLAGIPLDSAERTSPFPLLIGGGEGAFAPEPISPFLDAFVVGDGEQVILEICTLIEKAKGARWDRVTLLRNLADIKGVYVPEFYEFDYNDDQTIARIRPKAQYADNAPALPVHKRYFNVARDKGTIKPVVPLMRTIHDRLAIEIRRGCVNGCRFCQAGMITRPVNERSLEQIVEIAREGIANTGYDEISLLSLSSADYTMIGELVQQMTEELGPEGISISLPSLRINGFDVKLVDEIAKVRKSGFTFAPEAGTTRLREVINKPVDQDRFFEIIEDVFQRGWRTVKFYYMIGLPTETDEDLMGIVATCEHAAKVGRKYHGGKVRVNVTISPFVPKCNTPFQWEPQPLPDELERRYRMVRDEIKRRCGRDVDIKSADTKAAFIEAVLAKGDRRMAAVVRRAWELGARMDGWEEYFDFELWMRAFDEIGLNPSWFSARDREESEVLPWDHIESNAGRRFLWADQRRAYRQKWVEKCDTGKCAGCDVCNDLFDHTLAQDMLGSSAAARAKQAGIDAAEAHPTAAPLKPNSAMEQVMASRTVGYGEGENFEDDDEAPSSRQAEYLDECIEESEAEPAGNSHVPHPQPEPVQRLRVTFRKLGALRFLSHLDFTKVIKIILRRANAPLAYSQGFNPQPKLQYPPPLPLGVGGHREMLDLMLAERVDPMQFLKGLNAIKLDGWEALAVEEIELRGESLESAINASTFLLAPMGNESAWSESELQTVIERFEQTDSWPVEVRKKKGFRTMELKQSIFKLELFEPESTGASVRLALTISQTPGEYLKPQVAASALLSRPLEIGTELRIDRLQMHLPGEAIGMQSEIASNA